ncbi:hypothetical protein DRQ36_08510 [bacterium]|nr:MAG: hypothetical protein DRQ36_08510 [bacterium]
MQFLKKKSEPKATASSSKRLLGGLRAIAEALVIVLLIRWLVVEAHMVPTGSMIPTVLPGEYLLAEKLSYRFSEPRPGDIVVFKYPGNPPVDYVKRCIATAGQTVEIRDRKVFVDGVAIPDSKAHFSSGFPSLPNLLDIPSDQWQTSWENRRLPADVEAYIRHRPNIVAGYCAYLAAYYAEISGIEVDYDSLQKVVSAIEVTGNSWEMYLRNALDQGFKATLGESYSPEKVIPIIQQSLRIDFGGLSNKIIADNFSKITVPENTIFCMGDNRDFSLDSRFWGPVPLENVKGRPVMLYYSVEVKKQASSQKPPSMIDNIFMLVASIFRPGDIRFSRFFTLLF